jgi:hypothetical protein
MERRRTLAGECYWPIWLAPIDVAGRGFADQGAELGARAAEATCFTNDNGHDRPLPDYRDNNGEWGGGTSGSKLPIRRLGDTQRHAKPFSYPAYHRVALCLYKSHPQAVVVPLQAYRTTADGLVAPKRLPHPLSLPHFLRADTAIDEPCVCA